MDHARHVEGDFGEQKVPDHILQAHDETEEDLGDEQCDGGHEIQLGHALGLILHHSNS